MITARFTFWDSKITAFEVSGHSGSAKAGEDIVCAAVSSATYMTANTLTEILQVHPEIKVHEEDGFLSLSLSKAEAPIASDILSGFHLHLEQLSLQYPDYIKVEKEVL